jgi:uncharacterized membrane protein (DUF485 family)
MAHFTGPAPQAEIESAQHSARNARNGLILFAVYLAFYVGFVGLVAFAADWMRTEIAGVNVAIFYGLGLILGAFVLAAPYLWLCKTR